MSSGLFKNGIYKMCLEILYILYIQIIFDIYIYIYINNGFSIKWPIAVDKP